MGYFFLIFVTLPLSSFLLPIRSKTPKRNVRKNSNHVVLWYPSVPLLQKPNITPTLEKEPQNPAITNKITMFEKAKQQN